jgi:hypothetical protein
MFGCVCTPNMLSKCQNSGTTLQPFASACCVNVFLIGQLLLLLLLLLLQVIDASGGEPLDFGAIYKVSCTQCTAGYSSAFMREVGCLCLYLAFHSLLGNIARCSRPVLGDSRSGTYLCGRIVGCTRWRKFWNSPARTCWLMMWRVMQIYCSTSMSS